MNNLKPITNFNKPILQSNSLPVISITHKNLSNMPIEIVSGIVSFVCYNNNLEGYTLKAYQNLMPLALTSKNLKEICESISNNKFSPLYPLTGLLSKSNELFYARNIFSNTLQQLTFSKNNLYIYNLFFPQLINSNNLLPLNLKNQELIARIRNKDINLIYHILCLMLTSSGNYLIKNNFINLTDNNIEINQNLVQISTTIELLPVFLSKSSKHKILNNLIIDNTLNFFNYLLNSEYFFYMRGLNNVNEIVNLVLNSELENKIPKYLKLFKNFCLIQVLQNTSKPRIKSILDFVYNNWNNSFSDNKKNCLNYLTYLFLLDNWNLTKIENLWNQIRAFSDSGYSTINNIFIEFIGEKTQVINSLLDVQDSNKISKYIILCEKFESLAKILAINIEHNCTELLEFLYINVNNNLNIKALELLENLLNLSQFANWNLFKTQNLWKTISLLSIEKLSKINTLFTPDKQLTIEGETIFNHPKQDLIIRNLYFFLK